MEHRGWEGGGEGGGRGGKRRVMKKEEERVTLLCDGNKDLIVVNSLVGPTRGKPWQHEGRGEGGVENKLAEVEYWGLIQIEGEEGGRE